MAVNVGHRTLEASYLEAAAVTPDNDADLPGGTCGGLWIGTAGDGTLRVITSQGTQVDFAAVASGALLKLAVRRVMQTGTGASEIVALY